MRGGTFSEEYVLIVLFSIKILLCKVLIKQSDFNEAYS